MAIQRIAVLGAGHGGCAAAADLTLKGFEVRLQARRADRLNAIEANGGITARGVQDGLAPISHLTTNVAEAVDGADLIMLVVPSVAHEAYAGALTPVLDAHTPVFLNPGHTGGGLHFAHALARAGFQGTPRLCETVTLTYISRLEGAATVGIYGYTRRLMFAALPARETRALHELIRPLYPEIVAASSVLETGLSNMNAVFHPPGMLMNAGWIEHSDGDFLFYREGITEAVGQVVSALDAERVQIARDLGVATRSFLETFHAAGLTTDAALASMAALEEGAIANPDEGRMVGHYWLRSPDLAPDEKTAASIREVLKKTKDIAGRVHAGELQAPAGLVLPASSNLPDQPRAIVVDGQRPAKPVINSCVPTGGSATLTNGSDYNAYFNDTNTGASIIVDFDNVDDGTMEGGKVRIEGRIGTSNSWTALAIDHSITSNEWNSPTRVATVNIAEADIENLADFGHGKVIYFRAYNLDVADNLSTLPS